MALIGVYDRNYSGSETEKRHIDTVVQFRWITVPVELYSTVRSFIIGLSVLLHHYCRIVVLLIVVFSCVCMCTLCFLSN